MRDANDIRREARLMIESMSLDGMAGKIFMNGWSGTFVASWASGWEHVSVSPRRRFITPLWEDMCLVKDIFWNEDEAVIQIHPPKSEYVNNVSNCLHLWRCIDGREQPLPPSILVGLKGVTLE